MKHILLTGGAGYIGSHTAKALAEAGLQPIVLDDLSSGHEWAVRWGPLVVGDVGERSLVRKVIERYGIDGVIHFAAKSSVGESMANPREYFHNNVVKTLAMLDALLECRVRNIVFSSSCATYGVPDQAPIDESEPQRPISPYGESKLLIEKALCWYSQVYDLRYVSLRYFNAAGADPKNEIGEDHLPETHLIPLAIYSAMGIIGELAVYGTDYPTADGTAVRDYIHVSDIAGAHIAALRYVFTGGESTCLNVGTGAGYSVRQVVEAVEAVSGRAVRVSNRPRRAGDPPILVASPDRARGVLQWDPRITDLREIVATAWKWHTSSRQAVKLTVGSASS
jgi:UDP-glucose-4-epimerase GalE